MDIGMTQVFEFCTGDTVVGNIGGCKNVHFKAKTQTSVFET
jgi:hypothetical protein